MADSKNIDRLRACMNCSLIRTASQFKNSGCPNCPFLSVEKGKNFTALTTPAFKGMIGMVNPGKSWVAKWQRIEKYKPGFYAMVVDGQLHGEYIQKIEDSGQVYVDRSQAFDMQ